MWPMKWPTQRTDLDDGLRSGMITPTMLENIELWEVVTGSVGWKGGKLEDLDRHRIIRRLIGIEMNDVVDTTDQHLKDSGVHNVEELQKMSANVAGFSETFYTPQPAS